MVFAVFPKNPINGKVGFSIGFHLYFLICLIFFSCVATNVHAKTRKSKDTFTEIKTLPDPDVLLRDTYKDLANNDLLAAESKIDSLIQAYPHFQLAQLIKGDLLLMHVRPVTGFGAGARTQPDKLKDLRDEASVRINSLRMRPDPDLIPRAILQLRDDQKDALIIDAKKSRLYVYENHAGQPKLINDYYISHGKFGTYKFKEGDQKTPIGIYYITSHLSGTKLPDFYGSGALPLNYPNEWDKFNGRSGSGIWLHGMPSQNFSRPPLASDGCIVLTNPDFLKISALVDIGKTPVIISDQVEFVNRKKWMLDKQLAQKLADDWRVDMESQNPNRILANYSRNFKGSQGDNLNEWFPKQQQIWEKLRTPSILLKDVTLFRYPGKEDLIVSTFTEEISSGKIKTSIRKRQYWIKESARWRIIYESHI